MEILDDNEIASCRIFLSSQALYYLRSSVLWMRFIAVIGVFVGILSFVGLILFSRNYVMNPIASNTINFFILVLIGFYLYSSVSLFTYTNKITQLLLVPNTQALTEVFQKHKSYWASYGIILSGIILCFVLVVLLLLLAIR